MNVNAFGVSLQDNVNKRKYFEKVKAQCDKRGFDGISMMTAYPDEKNCVLSDNEKTSFFKNPKFILKCNPHSNWADYSPISIYKARLCVHVYVCVCPP